MNDLIDAVLARSTGKHSYFHGEDHWRRVAAAGHALLKDTPAADPLLVFLIVTP
jgi:hypothetical protein